MPIPHPLPEPPSEFFPISAPTIGNIEEDGLRLFKPAEFARTAFEWAKMSTVGIPDNGILSMFHVATYFLSRNKTIEGSGRSPFYVKINLIEKETVNGRLDAPLKKHFGYASLALFQPYVKEGTNIARSTHARIAIDDTANIFLARYIVAHELAHIIIAGYRYSVRGDWRGIVQPPGDITTFRMEGTNYNPAASLLTEFECDIFARDLCFYLDFLDGPYPKFPESFYQNLSRSHNRSTWHECLQLGDNRPFWRYGL